VWLDDSYTRLLLDSSTRRWTVGQRYDGWSVERVETSYFMRGLVTAEPIPAFDELGALPGERYLIEVSGSRSSQDQRRPSSPELSWDWTLDIAPVLLPVGAPEVPDEEVWVRLSGRGAQPRSPRLTPRTIAPYVAERNRLLGQEGG
jgi:hypothetical protein